MTQTQSSIPGGVGVRIDAVERHFGERQVLKGISLDLRAGEFLGIVGRSGCGKSTLLRLLAGLDRADGGQISLDGTSVNSLLASTRIMFQEARLLPWQRVIDNVLLGLAGVPPKEARARAQQALEEVGLGDRAQDWPGKLSGGQKQRVSLARALVGEPRLLLLDEPLGALDALTRIEMHALIERLWHQHRFTAVLVTHDVGEAVALADRVLLIDDGEVGLDLAIHLPRPRARGSAAFAALEDTVLHKVLDTPPNAPSSEAANETFPIHQLRWAI